MLLGTVLLRPIFIIFPIVSGYIGGLVLANDFYCIDNFAFDDQL
jgi:hypothetical protein